MNKHCLKLNKYWWSGDRCRTSKLKGSLVDKLQNSTMFVSRLCSLIRPVVFASWMYNPKTALDDVQYVYIYFYIHDCICFQRTYKSKVDCIPQTFSVSHDTLPPKQSQSFFPNCETDSVFFRSWHFWIAGVFLQFSCTLDFSFRDGQGRFQLSVG